MHSSSTAVADTAENQGKGIFHGKWKIAIIIIIQLINKSKGLILRCADCGENNIKTCT